MTSADFKRIEQELDLKLPAAYKKIFSRFPAELRDWPPLDSKSGYDRRNDFLLDPDAIIAANQQAHKKFRKRIPKGFFVYGGDAEGYWLIDTTQKKPQLHLINKNYLLDGFEDLDEHLAAVQASHKEKWAKSRNGTKAPAKKTSLTAEELLAEGRKLARPAVALYDTGKKYAAVWHGNGVVSPGPGEWRHWISIDTKALPENPRKLTGVVSVYEWFADDDRMGELKVVHDKTASLPKKTDGTKLYGKEFQCLPDVDALFQFGSKAVKNWVKTSGWDPSTGYDQSPVKDYLRVVHREHPFTSDDGTYAMLGGWSWCFNWCYGTDEEYPWHLVKKTLVVLTLAESEPWIEVFDDGKKFVTFSRIT